MSGLVPLRRDRRARPRDLRAFLPTSRAEMEARGWNELDVLLVTGDAYVDHPSFGMAIIGRALEAAGFRVGIVAQPRWDVIDDLLVMGAPRLFVGVTAGNMDSMLNRLTAQKKLRSEDHYSPAGEVGRRPNRATIVYANLCRRALPGVPIVIGGIEASLRRIAHYDYWEDQVRRSILLDSKADLLVFGMGERPVVEIARKVAAAVEGGATAAAAIRTARGTRGTAHVLRKGEWESQAASPSRYVHDRKPVVLPAYDEVRDLATESARRRFAEMSRAFQYETNPGNARPLIQPHGVEAVWFEPPAEPLSEAEMDSLYDAPYARLPHWSYDGATVPAFETIKHSIVTMRGCFGGCTFCSITEHEGRAIQSRSEASILREVRAMQRAADAIGFKGILSDLGGPTANMYKMTCRSEEIERACRKLSCVHPGVCENLVTDHGPLISLLKRVREEPGVRKVLVASGVRYDLADQGVRGGEFVDVLAAHHTGGQLSVAPEHNEDAVLQKMKKPGIASYERFAERFSCASQEAGKEQYLIPYFISGHPGSTLADMISLAQYLKARGMRPRQVQDFIPTPMSMATCMHVTGIDPLTMNPVSTITDLREKKLHKSLLLYWDPAHQDLAREALRRAGRTDLIGHGPRALVPPASRAKDPVTRARDRIVRGARGPHKIEDRPGARRDERAPAKTEAPRGRR